MDATKLNEQIGIIKGWLGTGAIDIFGLPFAGKDTHGHELAHLLDAPLIGGGSILRSDTMSPRIKKLMSTGQLLPTKDYLEIVLPHLSDPALRMKPLILSSVGRWHGEEAGVLEATAESGHPLRVVLYLEVTEEEVWRRARSERAVIDRGERADHGEDKLRVRLEEFRIKSLPVIDFYREQGLLITIDGSLPLTSVLDSIIERLCSLAQQNS